MEKNTYYIYLIKTVYLTHTSLKIGYTNNINERMRAYKCHNENFKLIEYATLSNSKSARVLEKEIHKEQSNNNEIFCELTEWVKYNHILGYIKSKQGLKRFKCLQYYAIKDICKVAQ